MSDDDLMADFDVEKAQDYFKDKLGRTVSKREAKINADTELRTFIINGGF